MKEPKTKVGKLLKKIATLLKKEAINHADEILKKLSDDEVNDLYESISEEKERRKF
jgi:hypothetical protein